MNGSKDCTKFVIFSDIVIRHRHYPLIRQQNVNVRIMIKVSFSIRFTFSMPIWEINGPKENKLLQPPSPLLPFYIFFLFFFHFYCILLLSFLSTQFLFTLANGPWSLKDWPMEWSTAEGKTNYLINLRYTFVIHHACSRQHWNKQEFRLLLIFRPKYKYKS